LLLLVIKVASLMKLESGDKVAVGGALTFSMLVRAVVKTISFSGFEGVTVAVLDCVREWRTLQSVV